MARMPSDRYWARRAEDRLLSYERGGSRVVETLGRAYREAARQMEADALAIYRSYQQGFDLTPEEARFQLAQPAGRQEYETLLSRIGQISDPALRLPLEARAASGAYGYRLSRLEALRMNLDAQVTRLAEVERSADTAFFEQLIPDAYNQTLYDIQRGVGLRFSFAEMNTGAVREILRSPWSGKQFSDRIWGNTRTLAEQLNTRITAGFLSGKSVRRMSADIAERMQVGFRNAERLVRTETNYMANAAEMQAYRECDIDKYRFLATLDNRTSKVCQDLDLQEFNVEDAVPGQNMPPMHPNCRSTTIVLIDGDTLEGMERRARNPVTGEVETVSAGMNYEEWQRWQADGAPANVKLWRNINNPDYNNSATRGAIATHDQFDGFSTVSDEALRRIMADTGMGEDMGMETAQAFSAYFDDEYTEIRTRQTPEHSRKADLMELYTRLAPKYNAGMFRGVSLSNDLVSDILQGDVEGVSNGLASWSAEEDTAVQFSKGYGSNQRVVFTLKQSGKAAYVAHISPFGTSEQELIMPDGVELRLIGHRTVGSVLYIDLEEVP